MITLACLHTRVIDIYFSNTIFTVQPRRAFLVAAYNEQQRGIGMHSVRTDTNTSSAITSQANSADPLPPGP